MNAIVLTIKSLREKLEKLRGAQVREYATRVIFIDPLLSALGWDVTDPDQAQLEYETADARVVNYALKLRGEPCVFLEARPLNDPLTSVEVVVQLMTSAANAGVRWCILTNGVAYEVYCTTEKPAGMGGLLFEVSLEEGLPIEQVAELFSRFSRDAMTQGVLDELGDKVFTMAKVRRALGSLLSNPPETLIGLIRSAAEDETLTAAQIGTTLKRLWDPASEEAQHPERTPQEVTELFQMVDRFCRELDPGGVGRQYRAKSVAYAIDGNCFCSVRLEKKGLHVWLVMDYDELDNPPDFVRDVSGTEHHGVGDVELVLARLDRFLEAKDSIRQAFEANRKT